jgi:hypothetical protein
MKFIDRTGIIVYSSTGLSVGFWAFFQFLNPVRGRQGINLSEDPRLHKTAQTE